MFEASTYRRRRERLGHDVGSGVVVLLGHVDSPMNYRDNAYDFRQDSSFLYFTGLDRPGLALVIDIDTGREILFGDDPDLDAIVWTGPLPSIVDLAARCAITSTQPVAALASLLRRTQRQGRRVHWLPAYRGETKLRLDALLGVRAARANAFASTDLVRAVIAQRAIKTDDEIAEIEDALAITREMHMIAMREARPGVVEQTIVGRIEGYALSHGRRMSYPVIFSSRGEILHNHSHDVTLRGGEMIVNDSGANSLRGYASDITRTIPVGGRFVGLQADIYDIVLRAQEDAIAEVRPGVPNRDLHRLACERMVEGMTALGFFRGDAAEIVAAGAHAVFFQCGVGHMMGLDVHDMEGLGEDLVGYDAEHRRSEQFGMNYLRLAKRLEAGNVITVEPGVYINPALLDRWQAEQRHAGMIDYALFQRHRAFGGVRIEDDLLVTADGARVLGPPLPKARAAVEDLATG